MAADPNKIILTGENPFIRLSTTGGEPFTTNASFWRIITCPAGPGHVLYLKSELTEDRWRIYSDNIAMARWLQATVQGMLNPETADTAIPVQDAEFAKSGDPRYFWTETALSADGAASPAGAADGDALLQAGSHSGSARRAVMASFIGYRFFPPVVDAGGSRVSPTTFQETTRRRCRGFIS